MFRRKKSQEPERVKQISISAPRAMSALPQPPSSPSSSAPLYERFARTTAGPGPSTNTNTNANLRAPNSARPRVASTSNGGSGGGGVRTKQTPQKPLPALAIREDTTLPQFDDRNRSRANTHVQQMSPPSSPTKPRHFANSNGVQSSHVLPSTPSKQMNGNGRRFDRLLDEPPPPSRLPSVKAQPQPKLSRLPTPPSPSLPAMPEATPPKSKHAGAISMPSTSYPSPLSPSTSATSDEGGLLPPNAIRQPTLGNSLETRAARRQKYSPLAAFGGIDGPPRQEPQATVPAPPPSKTPPPPPLPPKSTSRVASQGNGSASTSPASADGERQRSTLFVRPQLPQDLHPSLTSTDSNNTNISATAKSDFRSQNPQFAAIHPVNTLNDGSKDNRNGDDRRDSFEPREFHSPLFATETKGDANMNDGKALNVIQTQTILRSRAERPKTMVTHVANEMAKGERSATSGSGSEDDTIGRRNRQVASEASRLGQRGLNGEVADVRDLDIILDGKTRTEVNMQEQSQSRNKGHIKRAASDFLQNTSMLSVARPPPTPPSPPFPASKVPLSDYSSAVPIHPRQIPTPPTTIDDHGRLESVNTSVSGILENDERKVKSCEREDVRRQTETEMNGPRVEESFPLSSSTTSAHSFKPQPQGYDSSQGQPTRDLPQPRVQTDNFFSTANSPHPHLSVSNPNEASMLQLHTPMSPPHSPPQLQSMPSISSLSSHSEKEAKKRSKSRSKSRSRVEKENGGSRPGTASSALSNESGFYVSPSSASSLDGLGNRISTSSNSIRRPFASSPSPSSPNGSGHRKLTKQRPSTPKQLRSIETHPGVNEYSDAASKTPRAASNELLVDEDPFAKDTISTPVTPPAPPFASSQGHARRGSPADSAPSSPAAPDDYSSAILKRRGEKLDVDERELALKTPVPHQNGVDEHADLPANDVEELVQQKHESEPELEQEPEEPPEPTFYPLAKHLMEANLLAMLLPYLSMRDWNALISSNDAMRRAVEHKRELRELVLERFLGMVGYERWRWGSKERIMLTFRDLNSYMRGVSLPTHQFQVFAKNFLNLRAQDQKSPGDEYIKFNHKAATVQKSLMASSCRAYTRLVLRLRAQAECIAQDIEQEGPAAVYQYTPPESSTSVNASMRSAPQGMGMQSGRRSASRAPSASRPASPTNSSFSHAQSAMAHQHGRYASSNSALGHQNGLSQSNGSSTRINRYAHPVHKLTPQQALAQCFRSPLFKPGHAPCLRVFVPSPEGAWLSDASVIECEKELKRAGVLGLLRAGDVVWDAAVGDEGNVGRMIWDGNYLIDLDYTYSRTGEAPQYLHTLAFPPSYFHRVIRTSGNPICYIDVSPWGEEISAHLQLLQDRVKTETPQGNQHTVVRWVHRSRFHVHPRPSPYAASQPIPIPDTSLFVDPGWYGVVIIETEGTNEGLADLQARCRGIGFPPKVVANGAPKGGKETKQGRVWRLLRERSRPGEIWLRAVREKERLM